MTPLTINPGLRVGIRQGQLWAWEPLRAEPLTMRVRGLAALLAWRSAAEADLQAWRMARWLIEAAAGAADQPEPLAETALPPAAALQAAGPADLVSAADLALQPGTDGWLAWSPVLRAHVRLSPAQAAWALGLGLADAPPGERARLQAAGLLVLATPDTLPTTAPTAEPAVLRAGDPWAGLVPDGRTPIYFVTHHVDHLPLALGMLRAQILAHDGGALLANFLPLPIVSMSIGEYQAVYRRFGPGVWLFSDYMWSQAHNLQLSALVKAADPRNLTLHGGPSAPKYEAACRDFMQRHAQVDVVVRGAGEHTLVLLLQALARGPGLAALRDVPGLSFHTDGPARRELVRTPDPGRAPDLADLPSPYLSGMFDHYGGRVVAAILETNRGCPFGCTFCDWGSATQEKIRSFELERVKAEIDWIGRHRIRVLWIADANFGIFARDIDIAQHIADTQARHGFPREVVVNYPKNATAKIAQIVGIFVRAGICSQGIISIQTTDPGTLRVIRRDNIKTRKYDELGDIFRREGLPLSTDLMIGLPGATVQSFKADLQYYFDDDVTVKAYRTELLPNSPMADPAYRQAYEIRVDERGFLVSTASYSEADMAEMMAIWAVFDIADGHAVLRYVLRYLQWDHGIAATEFVHALVRQVRSAPAPYPAITWLLRHFDRERRALGGWGPLYAEIGRFAAAHFGVPMDSAFATVLQVNEWLLPRQGRRFPEGHALAHDLVRWFEHHHRAAEPSPCRLVDLPPGTLAIEDPYGLCELDFSTVEQYDNHQVFFDLPVRIARRRSAPNFVRKAA
ncbi:MAG: radical SAM protein [Rubrivivax sp.]|nr:radical SAM protein [Rubrivivax sp.]